MLKEFNRIVLIWRAYNWLMRYGISCGAVILDAGKVLLVHHREQGKYDFWVLPGGRLEGSESILDCIRREVWEETNLEIKPGKILYIQEFVQPEYHFIKPFLLCEITGGKLSLKNNSADKNFLVEARFFGQKELAGRLVYPEILNEEFWQDLAAGFPEVRYLGLKTIPED